MSDYIITFIIGLQIGQWVAILGLAWLIVSIAQSLEER